MIKLFTHTDLDGVGCAVLAQKAFGKDVDIEYCEPININQMVNEFLDSGLKGYEKIYITDLSVNEKTADRINDAYNDKNHPLNISLLDHHKTAIGLNKYQWAKVLIDIDKDSMACGTYIFYKDLVAKNKLEESFDFFVEKVRRLDTWEWSTKYNDIESKQLSGLLYLLGRERFVDKYVNTMDLSSKELFNSFDKLVLEIEQEKIDNYIEKKQGQVIVKEIEGYKAGIVFGEQYISELGDALAKKNKDLDFIVIVNPSESINYRGIKQEVDLSKIAHFFGGGGHRMASGSPVSDKMRKAFLSAIFDEKVKTVSLETSKRSLGKGLSGGGSPNEKNLAIQLAKFARSNANQPFMGK